MIPYSFLIFAILLQSSCALDDVFFPDDDYDPLPIRHERIRRFVRFMSRKPHPDALPETGIGFSGHVKNLLKGGTIGFEFQIPHVDRFGKSFTHWKDIANSFGYGRRGDGGKKNVDEEEKNVDEGEKKFDEEENKIDVDAGKDFDMLARDDYGSLINPRVKEKREP